MRVGRMQPQRRISGVANDTIYFCPQERSERGGVQPTKMPDVTPGTLPGALPSGAHKAVAWHCQRLTPKAPAICVPAPPTTFPTCSHPDHFGTQKRIILEHGSFWNTEEKKTLRDCSLTPVPWIIWNTHPSFGSASKASFASETERFVRDFLQK